MGAARQGVGLVGLGMALRPHLKSLRDLSDRAVIRAAWSPSADRRAKADGDLGLPVVGSLDAMLSDKAIQSVFVLAPPLAHLELVLRCAAAGKHVLVEKPLDVSSERALRAIRAMDAAGLQLGVVFQHRFRPGALALRAWLEEGRLGRLVSGSAAIRWWRTPAYFREPGRGMRGRDGGGVLLTQAIHTLDLLLDLAGPVRCVTALTRNSGLRAIDTEDIACGAIEFANGAVGSLDATNVAYPGFPERIELACEAGTAVLAGEVLDIYLQDGRHERIGEAPARHDIGDPMDFDHGPHRALIRDFLDSVEAGRPPRVHGRSALRVIRLIEAMLQSSGSGQAVMLQDGSPDGAPAAFTSSFSDPEATS